VQCPDCSVSVQFVLNLGPRSYEHGVLRKERLSSTMLTFEQTRWLEPKFAVNQHSRLWNRGTMVEWWNCYLPFLFYITNLTVVASDFGQQSIYTTHTHFSSYMILLTKWLQKLYLARVVNNDKLTVYNNIQFGVLSLWTLLNS
jgi:hypothetical protein